ncbi:TIR domain-containing protein [Novosphingobium lentum]|uniref:TIR domain-containing protein n=1 Tax=Novosphingobium lentum TaxID=145287 RepID=UPI000835F9F8|nr:TIR domain-containing protein [Novosphingobium lentum]
MFVSYARADRPRVQRLIEAIEGAGIEVWWDGLIEGGEAFARTIEARLDSVDAVLAVWSAASIGSDWVRDEAAHGRDRQRFVAVALDGSIPPLGFRQYHAVNLAGWNGQADAAELAAVLRAIDLAAQGQRPAGSAGSNAAGSGARKPVLVSRRAALVGGGAAVVALGGGLAAWHPWSGTALADSIAVLPFRNLSGDPQQGYFSDGLAEEIRARLASDAHLAVAAPTSSNLFRDSAEDARVVARKLGVTYLLEGAVRREGEMVRINASLIEGARGLTHWSQSFDRALKDVFAIESEVAGTVADQLASSMGARTSGGETPPAEVGGTTDVAAHDLYLQAKALYDLDKDGDTYRQAEAMIERAITADPGYAKAYLLQANILILIRNGYVANMAEVSALFVRALAAVRKALELAPKLSAAHVTLAYEMLAYQLDFRVAMPGYEQGYALNRNDPEIALFYANFMYKAGRFDDAQPAIKLAQERDPLNPAVFRIHAMMCSFMRQFDAARALFEQSLALNPKIILAHVGLGDLHLAGGRFADARAEYLKEPENEFRVAGLASAAARIGDRAGSDAALAKLVREFGDPAMFQQAQVHAQRGEIDVALAKLERAYVLKDSGLLLALGDIKLDPLRQRPEFGRLLARMGLSAAAQRGTRP